MAKRRLIGPLTITAGVVCILIKALTPETIDAQGFLHEAFFLVPCGFALIFLGIIITIIVAIKSAIDKKRR